MSWRRIGAITRKELRELRRNRPVVSVMTILPAVFLLEPIVAVFLAPSEAATTLSQRHLLLYLLAVPVLTAAMPAAYAIAGERVQGSLEPMLTTPIRGEELLVGKALAAALPAVVIAYLVFGIFVALVELFARPGIAPSLLRAPDLAAQLIFTPLLATATVWIAVAISTRMSDPRTAQQLSFLASIPLVACTSLLAFDVVHATLPLGLAAGVLLLLADVWGWRLVTPLLDRERLIADSR